MKKSDSGPPTPLASTKRTAGAPLANSEFVSVYVYIVFVIADTVIRVVHVAGGVRTWTLMFSSVRYPLTCNVCESTPGTPDQSYRISIPASARLRMRSWSMFTSDWVGSPDSVPPIQRIEGAPLPNSEAVRV